MPSDVSIRRFKGMTTDTPSAEGEIDELIQCENVQFDRYGQMEARPGFKFYANTPVGEENLTFLGLTTDKERILASVKNFAPEAYYRWPSSSSSGPPAPSLKRIGVLGVTSGSRTSNVVTLNITVSSHHGLAANDSIIVNVQDSSYNGSFIVASVLTGPHRITYSQIAADDAVAGTGEVVTVPKNSDVGVNFNSKLYFSDGRFFAPIPQEFGRYTVPSISQAATMVVHADRMWFIDRTSSQSRLRFSDPANPESWPAANFIDINPGDGSTVSDIRSFQNRLYIFKSKNVWVLDTPSTPTTWFLRKFTDIGCIDRQTIEYDGLMYWVADTGAYKFDGSEVVKISDPIQDVFDAADSTPFNVVVERFPNPPVFKDQWIINIFVGGISRIFCYNVKLGIWSEWVFTYFEKNIIFDFVNEESLTFDDSPSSMWIEYSDEFLNTVSNIYMIIRDTQTLKHSMIVGTNLNPANESWVDEIGTMVGGPKIIEKSIVATFQTKYSAFGDTYNKKRSFDWMLEHEGGDVLVEQIDERGTSVDKLILGSDIRNILHQNKIRGIGYFRRLSLKFTVTNFKKPGFRFFSIAGRMIAKGKTATNVDQVVS